MDQLPRNIWPRFVVLLKIVAVTWAAMFLIDRYLEEVRLHREIAALSTEFHGLSRRITDVEREQSRIEGYVYGPLARDLSATEQFVLTLPEQSGAMAADMADRMTALQDARERQLRKRLERLELWRLSVMGKELPDAERDPEEH